MAREPWAELYDLACDEEFGSGFAAFNSISLQLIEGIVKPPGKIVDFGAGTGRLSIPLARKGYVVHAVEPSREMADKLREKDALGLVKIHLLKMEDFRSAARFDLALCVFSVISFILEEEQLRRSFKAAAGCLKKGGLLLIDVPGRTVFKSRPGIETPLAARKVAISPVEGCKGLFRYHESITRKADLRRCESDFLIRCWNRKLVARLLAESGFDLKKDLSEDFRGFGADYWLVQKSG